MLKFRMSSFASFAALPFFCTVITMGSLASNAENATGPISPANLLNHIRVLSSDEFAGRAPGTPGEEKTVKYLVDNFKKLGLKPGNPDGTYVQKVPMVGLTPKPTVTFGGCASGLSLAAPEDFVAFSTQAKPLIETRDSDLVFVGYGIVAPEYGWDDYKGVDVRGKTLVMLINDPQIPDPANPEKLDKNMFKGGAMTYYGRWSYKYEIAAAKGAVGAIIIHETKPAAYPWFVVMNSNMRENLTIRSADGNVNDLPVRSWLRLDHAQAMLKSCGQDYESLKQAATRPDFKPVALSATASFHLEQTVRELDSYNVVAKIDGKNAKGRKDIIIYSAHWDHLGQNMMMRDHPIYHGARDNASGTASLLELARAFANDAKSGKPTARSVLFVATTSEEAGLLGARYYARNPLYPLAHTVADLNIDGINPVGLTHDVELVGAGHSDMDKLLADAVKRQNRVYVNESEPEKGYFYRADQFEFAKAGVPSLYLNTGNDFVEGGVAYGKNRKEAYVANDYHKPTDVVKPDWTMVGGAQDMDLLYDIGRRLANSVDWPDFSATSEFKAAHDVLSGMRDSKGQNQR